MDFTKVQGKTESKPKLQGTQMRSTPSQSLRYLPLPDAAALQTINAATLFGEVVRMRKEARLVRGGMYWKVQGQYEYLVRTSTDNLQTRIGARSDATQEIYRKFMARKEGVQSRLAALESALSETQRFNKAARAGRVPNVVVAILARIAKEGLGEHLVVVGTNALYAYESAAGVRVDPSALATADVDLLWDVRRHLKFATSLSHSEEKSILKILQAVDKSFERKFMHNQTAVNSAGFEVEFLRRKAQEGDQHPWSFSSMEGEIMPVQAHRANVLTEAPRFSTPVIAVNGAMAIMNTISPKVFVHFKRWLSQAPNRDAIKRQRDLSQAEIVQQLLDEHLLLDTGFPSPAKE